MASEIRGVSALPVRTGGGPCSRPVSPSFLGASREWVRHAVITSRYDGLSRMRSTAQETPGEPVGLLPRAGGDHRPTGAPRLGQAGTVIQPKDRNELARFSELLSLCIAQVEELDRQLVVPERPPPIAGAQAARVWNRALAGYTGTREGLNMALMRLVEVHNRVCALPQQPGPRELGMETRT
jgi:hypothetical protein